MRVALALTIAAGVAVAAATGEPDNLKLPPGFHATVVADALGPIRHLAVRDNGDIYVSTPRDAQGKGGGIIALRPDANHRADHVEHFGAVDGGTGIRFYKGALYATSPSGVYRFTFTGNELLPHGDAVAIVEGTPETHPGFNRTNRPIAFDTRGNLYLALDASANLCTQSTIPLGGSAAAPVGVRPCPDLDVRAGVWRFSADKAGQKFPADGEHWATGIRDIGRARLVARRRSVCTGSCTAATAPTGSGPIWSAPRMTITSPTRCTASRREPISAGRIPITTACAASG